MLTSQPHVATKQSCTFPHAKQSNGFGIVDLCLRDAASVVFHLKDQVVVGLRESHLHPRCLRMPDDVRERFLENPEKHGVQVLVPKRLLDHRLDAALDAGLFLELAGLPLERGDQAGRIQQTRAQFGRNPPDRLDRLVNALRH